MHNCAIRLIVVTQVYVYMCVCKFDGETETCRSMCLCVDRSGADVRRLPPLLPLYLLRQGLLLNQELADSMNPAS